MLIKYNQQVGKTTTRKYYYDFDKEKKVLKTFFEDGKKTFKVFDLKPRITIGNNIKLLEFNGGQYILLHKQLGAFKIGKLPLNFLEIKSEELSIKLNLFRVEKRDIVLKGYSKLFDTLIFEQDKIKTMDGYILNENNIFQLKEILKEQQEIESYDYRYYLTINDKEQLKRICYSEAYKYYFDFQEKRILFKNCNFKVDGKILNYIFHSQNFGVFKYKNHLHFVKHHILIKKLKLKEEELDYLEQYKKRGNSLRIDDIKIGPNIDNKKLNIIINSNYKKTVIDLFEKKMYFSHKIQLAVKSSNKSDLSITREMIRRLYLIEKFEGNND